MWEKPHKEIPENPLRIEMVISKNIQEFQTHVDTQLCNKQIKQ